ncbi:hypothetical protein C8Q74DRAFT_1369329 [Fomes fomentarius]|nr:hypothetical protein C8Q74DRAFT_1212765 [Fomes fomentarius]KAI0770112.1 hypothetical protein C8Q74DRAFT_1369329 [Fomes fomentarius]
MSSSTTRPKPRPRPRARAPAAASVDTDVPPSSSPGPSSAGTSYTQAQKTTHVLPTIEDEDALFLRNKTRSAQDWKRISKLNEEKESRKRKSSSSDSSDEENHGGSSPKSRTRKKRGPSQKKNAAAPDWTKGKSEIIISSDSDSDDLIPNKARKKGANGTKGTSLQPKDKRARSRSITPPPALPQYAIQRAREAVQLLVGDAPRSPSPTDVLDESTNAIELDPELASIARRVQSEAHDGTHTVGGPQDVKIRIAWKPHPMNPSGRPETWDITQKRHDNLHPLFSQVADLASIRVENLVVCYEGKRVFPSSTPHSIGIWAEAELEALEKTTYQYLQEYKRIRSPSVAPAAGHIGGDALRRSPSHARSQSIELSDDDSKGGAASAHVQNEDDKEFNTFHLFVRSARTPKDISLLVRPSTKCGAIVRAFLQKAGLAAEYVNAAPATGRGRGKAAAVKVPALSVDGDRMDPETEIGEADLEDGDQVEVVGL